MAAIFCLGAAAAAGAAAEPRLVLDAPAGAPFAAGELVRVPVFLETEAPGFKYATFGIQAGPDTELWFAAEHSLFALPGVEIFNDRVLDVRHVFVGIGNFDFNDPGLVVPVSGGRLRLGTVGVQIGSAVGSEAEVVIAAGECRCRFPDVLEPSILHLGVGGKLIIGGASARLPIGNRDFLRGDVNRDGRHDIGDPAQAINLLFLSDAALSCPDEIDANDDGALDVSDPVYLLAYLFLGGPPPPEPFKAPGSDPTADALGCHKRG